MRLAVCSLVFLSALALGSGRDAHVVSPALGQARPADDAPAINVHLPTLAAHLRTLGGMRVHVQELTIGEIVSPQSFTVRTRRPEYARALALLPDAPGRPFVPGTEIEIWGRAYSLAGASVKAGWPEELTPEAIAAFDRVPVILVEAIRAPGGVDLYTSPVR